MHAHGLQPVEHGEQMRKRARQPVDAHHDQRIAAAEATEQLRQFGAATVGAAGLLFDDLAASGRLQGNKLRLEVLAFCGDTSIAVGGHAELSLTSARLGQLVTIFCGACGQREGKG
jgi:hypothetical protein